MQKIKVSVPGRICLFGEHQDYLHLPVITAAVNLRIAVSGTAWSRKEFFLDLPDINDRETIRIPAPDKELSYVRERDYFRSVFNVIGREGIRQQHGFNCRVRGNIPINSGTSSSSALNIAWAYFLLLAGDAPMDNYSPEKVARVAYLAEVEEFGEPGGMMDHFATAIGGTLFIEFGSTVKVKNLPDPPGQFVLGDSRQPKDTKRILRRVKKGVLDALDKIKQEDATFSLKTCSREKLKAYHSLLTADQITVLEGTIANREITTEALRMFNSPSIDARMLGSLLNAHHEILDKKLTISTDKINHMLKNALHSGAYGGKINGSGGGGCMFVYAPENTGKVKRAIEEAGGVAHIVQIDDGAKLEST